MVEGGGEDREDVGAEDVEGAGDRGGVELRVVEVVDAAQFEVLGGGDERPDDVGAVAAAGGVDGAGVPDPLLLVGHEDRADGPVRVGGAAGGEAVAEVLVLAVGKGCKEGAEVGEGRVGADRAAGEAVGGVGREAEDGAAGVVVGAVPGQRVREQLHEGLGREREAVAGDPRVQGGPPDLGAPLPVHAHEQRRGEGGGRRVVLVGESGLEGGFERAALRGGGLQRGLEVVLVLVEEVLEQLRRLGVDVYVPGRAASAPVEGVLGPGLRERDGVFTGDG
nr:hypothetical protein GCM10025732_15910 [Glycomyces mayteni]